MKAINDSYIAIAATKDVQALCAPLVEILGIDGFCFHKIYPNGKEIFLSNDDAWVKHVHQHNYTTGIALDEHLSKMTQLKTMMWSSDDKIPILRDARAHGWCHGLSVSAGDNTYFGFTMKNKLDINVISTYLNHLEHLERFTRFFLEKAQALIDAASQSMILHQPNTISRKPDNFLVETRDKFIKATPITSYRTHTGYNRDLKFTPREIDCLLIRGYTSAEVATTLAIWQRTAETHLENIKNKTGVANKSELLRFIFSNHLNKFFSAGTNPLSSNNIRR